MVTYVLLTEVTDGPKQRSVNCSGRMGGHEQSGAPLCPFHRTVTRKEDGDGALDNVGCAGGPLHPPCGVSSDYRSLAGGIHCPGQCIGPGHRTHTCACRRFQHSCPNGSPHPGCWICAQPYVAEIPVRVRRLLHDAADADQAGRAPAVLQVRQPAAPGRREEFLPRPAGHTGRIRRHRHRLRYPLRRHERHGRFHQHPSLQGQPSGPQDGTGGPSPGRLLRQRQPDQGPVAGPDHPCADVRGARPNFQLGLRVRAEVNPRPVGRRNGRGQRPAHPRGHSRRYLERQRRQPPRDNPVERKPDDPRRRCRRSQERLHHHRQARRDGPAARRSQRLARQERLGPLVEHPVSGHRFRPVRDPGRSGGQWREPPAGPGQRPDLHGRSEPGRAQRPAFHVRHQRLRPARKPRQQRPGARRHVLRPRLRGARFRRPGWRQRDAHPA